MSEKTPEERMEMISDVIWMLIDVRPTQSVTEFQHPMLSWEYQGNKADLVFSERPYLSVLEAGAEKHAAIKPYSTSLANHSDEELLKALKWFKVI